MPNKSLTEFIQEVGGDDSLFENFLNAVRGGQNSVTHNQITQALMLDDTWILTIESALYSIENIVRNPRKFIAEDELIVDVGKARRTNSKTVRHLTSHSQYIQNIDKDGEVRPKKLLVVQLDEDLAIYENRFVCALINRLIHFVEQRHRDLDGKMDVSKQTSVRLKSDFNYGESKFVCDIHLMVEQPPEDKAKLERNKDLFERVEVIRRRLRVLQSTEFMKELNGKKPVRPPIQKTNLLKKNVDYNNCYKLWLYISSYTYLGYSIEVKDKSLPVDGDYFDDLTYIAGLSMQSLVNNHIISREKYAAIPYSEAVERNYNLVTNLKFTPNFDASKQQAGEESINEYYFRRMKDELTRLAGENDIEIEKRINVNFIKFFRSISRINDALYDDLIEEQIAETGDKLEKSGVQKKQMLIKQQQERIRRRAMLTKLKWEELERAQRKEERARTKLEKLKKELTEEKQAAKTKKVKKTKLVLKANVKRGNKS
ncbi:MAG: DUF2357 domain-containing protein [Candidatus Coproplasma sp.]